ncbi:MAG: HEPN domain-containing protein, partial [Lachnospiraceae bacterium]|nr:HEPN domain-containing protein [Lachnospiraceae bacterium]
MFISNRINARRYAEFISREIGRKVGRLQQKREKSDYDDFYLASKEETIEQIESANEVIANIKNIWARKNGTGR